MINAVKTRILIVDDKPANLLALKELLLTCCEPTEDADFLELEVLEASTGEAALSTVLEKEINLVLLDVQMPDMDGYEVAKIMRANERTSKIPIIFLSAVYTDAGHISLGYKGGAIDFISKPLNPELLKIKVKNFLIFQNMLIRATTLKKENEIVLEAYRLKSQFLMNMSHELRTPMHGLLGNVDLLGLSQLSAEQKESLEIIKSSGIQMLRLIDDILDTAKLESRSMKLEKKEINLSIVVKQVVNFFRSQLDAKKIILQVTIDKTLPSLIGDPRRIRQVLTNLVSNAIKFTEKGSISIKVSSQRQEEGKVFTAFEVTDTGIGLSKEDKDSLFKIFSQVDALSTKKYAGMGLGLVICKRLVEIMQGELTYQSQKGKGSTFLFIIPLDSKQHVPLARVS